MVTTVAIGPANAPGSRELQAVSQYPALPAVKQKHSSARSAWQLGQTPDVQEADMRFEPIPLQPPHQTRAKARPNTMAKGSFLIVLIDNGCTLVSLEFRRMY
jgi:hypothetical protein